MRKSKYDKYPASNSSKNSIRSVSFSEPKDIQWQNEDVYVHQANTASMPEKYDLQFVMYIPIDSILNIKQMSKIKSTHSSKKRQTPQTARKNKETDKKTKICQRNEQEQRNIPKHEKLKTPHRKIMRYNENDDDFASIDHIFGESPAKVPTQNVQKSRKR